MSLHGSSVSVRWCTSCFIDALASVKTAVSSANHDNLHEESLDQAAACSS